jgi:uncharacterized membrane protein
MDEPFASLHAPFASSSLPETQHARECVGMPIAAPAPAAVPSVSAPPAASRLSSIDVVRGVVMVLMAIDHVRVYSGVPAGGPTPGIFFTRWVTHFCAPAFVFLAGTSAFLHGRKLGQASSIARYLVTRGAVLVLLELTVIRLAWTFNVDFAHYILAGVIWMLGWCMILLAGLVYLPLSAITGIGLAIVVGHNLIDPFLSQLIPAAQKSGTPWLWQVLYLGPIAGGSGTFVVLYSIVPWIGVMAIGYAFGAVMVMEPERRRRTCVILGLTAIAAFIALRATRVYGDPRAWNGALGLGFLNTTKYPASLQFLLMTLGPTIALLPLVERARGRAAGMFVVFGRVPLFYYLLHIPAIHAAAMIVSLVREGRINPWLFANHPMANPPAPEGYTWSLGLLYPVFFVVVAALYVPCRWFARVKARQREGWLRYL